jgi:hypothetical protein
MPLRSDPLPPGPGRLFTLDQDRKYADELKTALDRLEKADVRVPRFGRLRTELALLQQLASSGTIPTRRSEQVALFNAMTDALDYHDIVAFLGGQLQRLAQELKRSMRGGSHDRHSRRDPHLGAGR